MELRDEFADAVEELEDLAETFTWNEADYAIWPGSAVSGKDLAAGGFKLRNDLRFVARAAQFPDPGPALKQMLTYRGTLFRIDTIETLPGGALLRFECNDPRE